MYSCSIMKVPLLTLKLCQLPAVFTCEIAGSYVHLYMAVKKKGTQTCGRPYDCKGGQMFTLVVHSDKNRYVFAALSQTADESRDENMIEDS